MLIERAMGIGCDGRPEQLGVMSRKWSAWLPGRNDGKSTYRRFEAPCSDCKRRWSLSSGRLRNRRKTEILNKG